MTGLRLMNELMDPGTRERVIAEHASNGNGVKVTTTVKLAEKPEVRHSPKVRTDLPIPAVASLERKVRLVPDLREVWSYINPYMLYGRHMGYRGNFEKDLTAREAKAVELFNEMEEVKNEAAPFMKVRAVWQFFEAESDGDALQLFTPGGKEPLHTWRFKRQKSGDQLCLGDYVLPPQGGQRDRGRRSARARGESQARRLLL
jgi:5-methyltetrahydrofolate--homocysteine methyltransferase